MSTSIGMLPKAAIRPNARPIARPTRTASQFQSMPKATMRPEPIAKPKAPKASTTATA